MTKIITQFAQFVYLCIKTNYTKMKAILNFLTAIFALCGYLLIFIFLMLNEVIKRLWVRRKM
jgi:hypothetical protein